MCRPLLALGSLYAGKLLPRFVDKACGVKAIRDLRAEVADGLRGDVVEIGFGSGLNVPHLPGTVSRLLAVDPAVTGRRLAARRLDACAIPVEFVGLNGENIPLDDESADAALSTFTMCTIPDVARALDELHRVLRPSGQLHFLEHGLSPDPSVAKWQQRLTPLQRRICGGMPLRPANRPTPHRRRIRDRDDARNHYLKGPKTPSYLYLGVARKA